MNINDYACFSQWEKQGKTLQIEELSMFDKSPIKTAQAILENGYPLPSTLDPIVAESANATPAEIALAAFITCAQHTAKDLQRSGHIVIFKPSGTADPDTKTGAAAQETPR